jgi:predicted phage terminase large subunit-like protein
MFKKGLCLMDPSYFNECVSFGRWHASRHLSYLSYALADVAAGKIKRLMVFMPPRHGKSEMISKYFPVWYLGQFPDRRIILTSYEADFAASWGMKSRNVISDVGHEYFNIEISPDSSARNRWDISGHQGGLNTAGVGGAITGRGADVLIIDDPVKNAQEANSKTYRDNTFEWFKSTAYTRLEPQGAIILIQTRWHEDDLAGRLIAEMKQGGEPWDIINFPAIAEENDTLGRQPGEALFPERFPIEELNKIRTNIGSYWFNSLYQQRPQASDGSIFKRQYFRYFTSEANIFTLQKPEGKTTYNLHECMIFQTCDPAGSTKTTADYFVLATWAKTPKNDLLLLDIIRMRLEGPDQINLFKQAHARWKPAFQATESKGIGLTLYQMLVREGLPVRELKADADKVTRALPAAARMESGSVYFLSGAPWLSDYEMELIAFPQGTHDDQVDVTGYAAISIINMTARTPALPSFNTPSISASHFSGSEEGGRQVQFRI